MKKKAAKKAAKKRTFYKSSISGGFVPEWYARLHPDTTYKHTIKKR